MSELPIIDWCRDGISVGVVRREREKEKKEGGGRGRGQSYLWI